MDTRQKLILLADAAKYDASCASSGTTRRDSSDGPGIGSTEGAGICLVARARFTVDLNRTPKERLPRVPGLGVKSVGRPLLARRARSVRRADLDRRQVPVAKVLPFVALPDHLPREADAAPLRRPGPMPAASAARAAQAGLFGLGAEA